MAKDSKYVRDFFENNGYISPLDVLNTEETDRLRENFNKCEQQIGEL